MAKKAKEKKQKEKTKDERFNFDEEIIIGLKRIDDEVDKSKASEKQKKQAKKNTTKNKKNSKTKSKEKEKNSMDIPPIGANSKRNVKTSKRSTQKKQVQRKQIQKKLTPQQELARKKRKVIFRITKWMMLFAIIIGASIYALLSPIFNVNNISVIGNSKISVDEIISLSGIELEQNMFQYRKEDIIKKVKENAYIDTVKVSRKIPDTVEITVLERKASFLIQFANAYACISSQGYILEMSKQKVDLPVLIGFQTEQENIQTGYRLCTEDLQKLGDVLKIMEAATSNGLAEFITQIDITNDDNYVLTLQKKKKTVYLGDTSNLSTKMLWILKFNEVEGNTQGDIILNMNLNDEKNEPYFRKKV